MSTDRRSRRGSQTSAHWKFPERQQPRGPREKSKEHKFLTPVLELRSRCTACPGPFDGYAYTFSEGRTAQWLLLIAGDRVDVLASRIVAVAIRRRAGSALTSTEKDQR